jgi:hypothetical protein
MVIEKNRAVKKEIYRGFFGVEIGELRFLGSEGGG